MATRLTVVSKDDPEDFLCTIAECRKFCRLYDQSQDETLFTLRAAAIEFIEGQLREELLAKTWRLTATAGEITDGMVFPKWPVQSIVSISSGSASVDYSTEPPVLRVTGLNPSGTVTLDWRTGLSNAFVPGVEKLLILQMVADWRANAEASGGSPQLSIGTRLLLEGRNKHIDAVRG